MSAPGIDTEKHEGAARAFYRLPTPINALELARADAFALRNFDHGMAIVKARDELLALREERAQLISAPRTACDMLRDGRAASIHVPNAGAGSHREFFTSLGFTEARVIEQSSSAGDWSFAVQERPAGMWYPATQTNRYPRHGFEYTVDFTLGFSSFDELCRHHEL